MKTTILFRRLAAWHLAAVLTLAGGAAFSAHAGKATGFSTQNNDSDIPGVANVTDADLINPWGLSTGPEGNVHVCDNRTGVATLYGVLGASLSGTTGVHAVTILPSAVSGSSALGSPTGVDTNYLAFAEPNSTTDFIITSATGSGPARYIYCTEDGAIEGYSDKVNLDDALIVNDQSANGAGYTGIALSFVPNTSGTGLTHQLYAANFSKERVEVFNNQFVLSGTITDPTPPAIPATAPAGSTWSPFNVHRFDYKKGGHTVRNMLVVYALHNKASAPLNDIPGAGNGYAALYTPEGVLESHLDFGKDLNSPWGIAIAHGGLGSLTAPLVIFVGNHGDGEIHAYAIDPAFPDLDKELGVVNGDFGAPIAIQGLWALHFGTHKITFAEYIANPSDLTEDKSHFFFSAGIVGEDHGLIGRILAP